MYVYWLCLNDCYYLVAAAISDECVPLPITPVVVGHDHEWLSVSPLALPSWVNLTYCVQTIGGGRSSKPVVTSD